MAGQVYLTREGYQKLADQLEFLKTTERQKIAKATGAGGFQTGAYGQPYDWLLQSIIQSNGGTVLSADRLPLPSAVSAW